MQQRPLEDAQQQQREALFTRLVNEHARLLYRVAYSLLRHPQDAEDAVQDALLKLYRGESWKQINEAGAIQDERAFLARVVWRAALDRRGTRTVSTDDAYAERLLADTRPSPELEATQTDERALLQELIETLPDELRQPLLLSAMEELNSREIGVVMGLPEGTIRTRLMRARAKLKQKFEALSNEALSNEARSNEAHSNKARSNKTRSNVEARGFAE